MILFEQCRMKKKSGVLYFFIVNKSHMQSQTNPKYRVVTNTVSIYYYYPTGSTSYDIFWKTLAVYIIQAVVSSILKPIR